MRRSGPDILNTKRDVAARLHRASHDNARSVGLLRYLEVTDRLLRRSIDVPLGTIAKEVLPSRRDEASNQACGSSDGDVLDELCEDHDPEHAT